MARRALCAIAALDHGRVTVDLDAFTAVLVLRDGDAIHVVDGHCPHQFAPLHDGRIEAGVLVCPHHGWRFRLSDGISPDTPYIRVLKWKHWLDDGQVWIEVP